MPGEPRLTILATFLSMLVAATVLTGCGTEQQSAQNGTDVTSTPA